MNKSRSRLEAAIEAQKLSKSDVNELVESELKTLGYKDCGKTRRSAGNEIDEFDPVLFQKRFWSTDEHSVSQSEGKRFVDVWQWDLRKLRSRGGGEEGDLSYEIGSTFEASGGNWVTIKFYGISPLDILDQLEVYEQRIKEAFDGWGGVYQS